MPELRILKLSGMKFWCFLASLFAAVVSGLAAESHHSIVTLTEENDDLANNGDQHYTQGIRLSYMLGEDRTPRWAATLAEKVPELGMKLEAPRFGLAAGQ